MDSKMDATLHALITSADGGDRAAADALFAVLYNELHRLAQFEIRKHEAGFGATTLLHEAYLAMADRDGTVFPDRARFMAYAARVMRGLIIDDMRARHAQKRGGGYLMTTLHTDLDVVEDPLELSRLSDALDDLASRAPELAELVDLRYFCGFTLEEIGAMQGISDRTVKRNWQKARIYLHGALKDSAAAPAGTPDTPDTPDAGRDQG
jgi:RNA polymerase sigma factor (TIGR02999 family)